MEDLFSGTGTWAAIKGGILGYAIGFSWWLFIWFMHGWLSLVDRPTYVLCDHRDGIPQIWILTPKILLCHSLRIPTSKIVENIPELALAQEEHRAARFRLRTPTSRWTAHVPRWAVRDVYETLLKVMRDVDLDDLHEHRCTTEEFIKASPQRARIFSRAQLDAVPGRRCGTFLIWQFARHVARR